MKIKVFFLESIVKHFAFVYCHPFCDGNGRMARLLERDNLIKKGYECFRFITTSKYLSEHSEDYYASIRNSENKYLDITPFVEFCLKSYISTFYDLGILINHI